MFVAYAKLLAKLEPKKKQWTNYHANDNYFFHIIIIAVYKNKVNTKKVKNQHFFAFDQNIEWCYNFNNKKVKDMIIIENVKEQLSKQKETLNIIKECLWLSSIKKRFTKFEASTRKSRFL